MSLATSTRERKYALVSLKYGEELLRRNLEIVVLTALLALLLLCSNNSLKNSLDLYKLVDWESIATLAGIILITTSIRESNLFDRIAANALEKAGSERMLAMLLVVVTAAMATILTNDIALLVVVPLTLSLQGHLKNDIGKIVVFEAIAANVGSALTPIGNPQNLFIWHRWDISFLRFTAEMAPMALLAGGLLFVFAWLSFGGKTLEIRTQGKREFDREVALVSLGLLVVYVILSELRISLYGFPILLVAYYFLDRQALGEANWALVVIFILMFVDFHLLASVSFVARFMKGLGNSAGVTFVTSILASQVMSNVPAAILVSQFTHNWQAIAYGVNIGGNGLAIGSLANLIALKMVDDRKIWVEFHAYSIAYLAASAVLVYFLLL